MRFGFYCFVRHLNTRIRLRLAYTKSKLVKTSTAYHIHTVVKTSLPVLLFMLLLVSNALASLGDSVIVDHGKHRVCRDTMGTKSCSCYTIIQTYRNQDSLVKEYVNDAGLVFGVTWQARRVPNMKTLLGRYFPEFQIATQARGHKPGPLNLKTKNLIVESAGHMRAFHGRAYLPDLLPMHISPADLQ